MTSIAALAPGKLMLSGEYVVLDGAPALVTAVDRDVVAEVTTSAETSSAEVNAVLSVARETGLVASNFSLHVNVDALQQNGHKLGIGSSAASAVAAAAACFAQTGRAIDDARDEIFSLAQRAHRAVAPEGSGADVAASTYGGTISFVRKTEDPQTSPVLWPKTVFSSVVWTGESARTSELLAPVRAVAARSPYHYRRASSVLLKAAEAFHQAFTLGDAYDVVDATEMHARGLSELGHVLGVPIMTDTHARIGLLAARFGGAAKPSGAGGGDCAIAFFLSAEEKKLFEDGCRSEGLSLLSVQLGAPGVRLRSA